MKLPDGAVLNVVVDWLSNGFWQLAWWQIVLFTLAVTHVTMISVTAVSYTHLTLPTSDLV